MPGEKLLSLGPLTIYYKLQHLKYRKVNKNNFSIDQYRIISEMTSDYFYAMSVQPDGTCVVDWIGGAFERITGLAPHDIGDHETWMTYIRPEDIPRCREANLSALTNQPSAVEYRVSTVKNGECWLREYARPIWNEDEQRVVRIIGAVQDISERKHTEEALRESEERLEMAIRGAGIGYWDQNFKTNKIIRSRYWAEMLGYMPEEIDSSAEVWKDLIHLDDVSLANRVAADHESGRTPFFKVEHRMRAKNGEWKWILNWGKVVERDEQGKPVRAAGIHLDITELKLAEEALRESEERYRSVVEQSQDAIFLVDVDTRRLIDVNPALERLTGYSRSELCKMTLYDLVAHDREDVDDKIGQIVGNKGSFLGERRYRRQDGTIIFVEVGVNLIHCNGKQVMCVVSRDITARRQAEEERRKLEAKIQEAQKLKSLGILAGGIAHDFNNLLVGVIGNASLALDDLSPGHPVRPLIEQIEKSGRRAGELSKQLLAYSGKGTFVVRQIDLSELVEDMVNLLKASISKKAVLKFNFTDNLPAIEADATEIRQVVMNLITNASEALAETAGEITVSTGLVECNPSYLSGLRLGEGLPAGSYVYLEVADTGCGMEEEIAAKIFDPYFSTKFTGRGLGLAAVLGIVRAHRGALEVRSTPGCGTFFRVLFPASEQPLPEQPQAEAVKEKWRGEGVVLVVDDEEIVRNLAKKMLSKMGFSVLEAGNGREGIELFRRHADRIRFVLLDMTMPEMGGEETFYGLRMIKPDIRILLTSGYHEQPFATNLADDEFVKFLEKPFKLATLMERIRHLSFTPVGKQSFS